MRELQRRRRRGHPSRSRSSQTGEGQNISAHHRVHLVRNVAVVLAGQLFTDRTLHQSRQRRQDAVRSDLASVADSRRITEMLEGTLGKQKLPEHALDGRVDLLVVQRPVDRDLALGDVTRQVGNRVGDVWVARSTTRKRSARSSLVLLSRGHITDGGNAPSFGMVKIGICVIDPFRPSTRPARS
jgi:hypothetical protein